MFISRSVAETETAGAQLAEQLVRGDAIGLEGELGAGKTHFVKGIARGLGCAQAVTSPTFTIIHEYNGGRLPIYHFDFYRLENADEVLALGLEEYLESDGVCVIEWAEKFRALLPPQMRWVRFEIASAEARAIRIVDKQDARGEHGAR